MFYQMESALSDLIIKNEEIPILKGVLSQSDKQSLTEIKPPADCRNAQLKMSARLTRIPQQERRGVLKVGLDKIDTSV